MSTFFEKGREAFADGTADWDTHTFAARLLDLHVTTTGIKPITGATNASPIVITAVGHGFAAGDLVYVDGVLGNPAASGLWRIASPTSDTFELTRPDGGTTQGSGTYSSGGYAVCLGPSAAGDNLDDFSAAVIGPAANLTSLTKTNGYLDAADTVISGASGATVEAVLVVKETGVPSTSRAILLHTGKFVVTCAAAAAPAATSLAVEALPAALASGTVLTFSNGAAATLSSTAAAGSRLLSVSSLAGSISAGSRALAAASGSGFPLAATGTSVVLRWAATGLGRV